jgi:hypothetical protein
LQELADELEEGRAALSVSTSKRVVPKVLRLTWNGFPLHHHKVEKWGYLVPTEDALSVLQQVGRSFLSHSLKQCCGSMTFWGRIRIRGSMPLTNGSGSGSCFFRH